MHTQGPHPVYTTAISVPACAVITCNLGNMQLFILYM